MSQFPFLTHLGHEKQDNLYVPLDHEAQAEEIARLEDGNFLSILTSPLARRLLGHDAEKDVLQQGDLIDWPKFISDQIQDIVSSSPRPEDGGDKREAFRPVDALFLIGLASFHAFLQSNVTGPPLAWDPSRVLFSDHFIYTPMTKKNLLVSLTVDGEAAYTLAPHIELFSLAKLILNDANVVSQHINVQWARLRINFWHQRLLNDSVAALQQSIYADLRDLEDTILQPGTRNSKAIKALFLLERAAINTHHGFDVKAREDLKSAARETGLQYVLTGRLGKRTKYQEKDLSQLVVLAKNADNDVEVDSFQTSIKRQRSDEGQALQPAKPENLDLNDDTVLEKIDFSNPENGTVSTDSDNLPPALAQLDPSDQPILKPADSIILLSLASSITNTSPQHGLTREETLPYATRVLDGGSSNWQIYTQALLVRSRIEGYKSRTMERGVLQLQALVDQVIAETTTSNGSSDLESPENSHDSIATTFLPRSKPSESASVKERLLYIHQLASPFRWTLEAELAARWVSLGGLRTALEIYERLGMLAESALCWAAVDREDKARTIIRQLLYHPSPSTSSGNMKPSDTDEEETETQYTGEERDPLPSDAPRLLCILGDLEDNAVFYERAWTVSDQRYARAQRSLGKHYLVTRNYPKADEAYAKSLKLNPLNHSTWFALGCVRLELEDFKGAIDAFTHTVQIEDQDAEAWSNLAAALLRLPPNSGVSVSTSFPLGSHQKYPSTTTEASHDNPQRNTRSAFIALKRASALKRENHRIWSNLLTVSASLSPPPYTDIIIAQQRIIELRGSVEGESCIDIEILEGLLSHVIATDNHAAAAPSEPIPPDMATSREEKEKQGLEPSEAPAPRSFKPQHGLENQFSTLIRTHVTPLITHSTRLWLLTARFALYQNKPSTALEAYEKAWRTTLNRSGWESGGGGGGVGVNTGNTDQSPEQIWTQIVDSTIELADAYESLGPRERTEGLGSGGGGGNAGELVAKGWKFKAKSAISGVLGRAREGWEDSEGWARLQGRLDDLRRA
ncbi:hypothetical protein MMC09_005052 [Bachmanniomyces sp. S44760]|nr:hypothetical protein [Bachmanniomyces sp. S44760]